MEEIGPNNGRGRPPGATNLVNREFKDCWHLFLTSQEYRDSAKKRILEGSAPHLESYLLNRIYGRPKEMLEVSVSVQDDLSTLSVEQLALRAEELLRQLQDATDLESAIPTEYFVHTAPQVASRREVAPEVEPQAQSEDAKP